MTMIMAMAMALLTMITVDVTGYELRRRVRQKCGKPFCRPIRHQVPCHSFSTFSCNLLLRGSDDAPPSINGLSGEDCQVLHIEINYKRDQERQKGQSCFKILSALGDSQSVWKQENDKIPC